MIERAFITLWHNLHRVDGMEPKSVTWDALLAQFSKPQPFDGDHNHPGWSPAEFDPIERKLEHVVSVSAMVLDYDGTETLDSATQLWGKHYGLIHTTRKHTPASHRFRVILPFSRLVRPGEYAAIWRRTNAKAGGKIDQAAKDPSRFWFTPGTPNPDAFQARHLSGQPLDPDVVLAEPEPQPKHAPQPILAPLREDAANAYKRASAYIARAPEAISGQRGHDALWSVTFAVVHGFGLSEQDAFSLIWTEYNPRCRPAWNEREIWHKIRSASQKAHSSLNRGYLLERNSANWQDHVRDIPPAPRPPAPAPPEDKYADAEDWDRGGDSLGATPSPAGQAEAPPQDAVTRYRVRSLGQILAGVYHRVTQPKPEMGARCGIEEIDEALGGFRRGKVTVLGASTSWGKSTFATLVSDVSKKAGKRVLLITGEDTEDLYGQRVMARRSGVSAMRLRNCAIRPQDAQRMVNVLAEADSEPFFLDGIGQTAEYLSGAIRAICEQVDIDLVIVDYLQSLKCAKKCQDRRTEITHIAREFTDAIKASGTSGLLMSQLKRLEDNQVPTKHDLKESGDVENMAEHVLLGYYAVDKENGAKKRFCLIDKNKDGPIPDKPIEILMDPVTAAFREQKAQYHTSERSYEQD